MLMHPTSLASRWGTGDLGPSASEFIDLLEVGKQSVWQVLPLTPVASHGSPYSPHSLFAGNPLLLSPESLQKDGYLRDLPAPPAGADPRVLDYGQALAFKDQLVENAFVRLMACEQIQIRNGRLRKDSALPSRSVGRVSGRCYRTGSRDQQRRRESLPEKHVWRGILVDSGIAGRPPRRRQKSTTFVDSLPEVPHYDIGTRAEDFPWVGLDG